jgi:hypothetical protein
MGFGSQKLVTSDVDASALLYVMRKLPKEVQNELRKLNAADAEDLKQDLKTTTRNAPPQKKLIQGAVYVVRDRNIRVDIGGKKQVGRAYKSKRNGGAKYRSPAGALVYGSEYGSSGNEVDRFGRKMGKRFELPHNPRGYWIAPTVEKYSKELLDKWKTRTQRAIEGLNLDG